MERKTVLGLAILLLFFCPALAGGRESVGLEDVVNALETPFKSSLQSTIVDFQADFLQRSHIVSLDQVQMGQGKVAVKFDRTPEKDVPLTLFRWDYDQPTKQEVVSDGRTMWVYIPENRQVIQSGIDISQSDDPLVFLRRLGNLSEDFTISWAEPNKDNEGNYILELKPKRPSSFIHSLVIVVQRHALSGSGQRGKAPVFPICSTTIYDPSDNRTIIEFTNVTINQGLPDSYFRFIIPTGVEVLRPTAIKTDF
jgi:outer membrane lipoprotein carrier protein